MFRELEGQVARAVKADPADRATDRYQAAPTKRCTCRIIPTFRNSSLPAGNNLVARLAALTDDKQVRRDGDPDDPRPARRGGGTRVSRQVAGTTQGRSASRRSAKWCGR